MEGALEEQGTPLSYIPHARSYDMEYGIVFQNQETGEDVAVIVEPLIYCPWCGVKLPKNLFVDWVKIVENEFNIDTLDKEGLKKVPEEYMTEKWWKKRGL